MVVEGKRGLGWDGEECRSSSPEKACIGMKIDVRDLNGELRMRYSIFHEVTRPALPYHRPRSPCTVFQPSTRSLVLQPAQTYFM